VNLVSTKFSGGTVASHDDGPAFGINLDSVPQCHFKRDEKEILEHLDDVVISMVVIVEEDDMVETSVILPATMLDGRGVGGRRNSALHLGRDT
jgi:hypothetical protein